MKIRKTPYLALIVGTVLCLSLAVSANSQDEADLDCIRDRLELLVRYELTMLAGYSVFDNLEFEIADVDSVVLSGKVTRPSLKSNAESAIRTLEGVVKVVNRIEVLPISPEDERIRLAVYSAVFGETGLDAYAMRAVSPIHFIVENGSIALVGVVATQADKDLAGIAASRVAGVSNVINSLQIKKGRL